ncbi:MAG: efflux RND transporter periplasmic adaptor subunit [Planctomycetaceae bacterium]|nr:efflux RND transporter periplasmic adaptor subunit [Planctomycetaceae bacterium]
MLSRKYSAILALVPVVVAFASYYYMSDPGQSLVAQPTGVKTTAGQDDASTTEGNVPEPADQTDASAEPTMASQPATEKEPVTPKAAEAHQPEPKVRVSESTHVSAPARSSRSKGAIQAFTEPYRDISVAAAEMGTLSELKVTEGQIVHQGDVLAVLDDEVLQASLQVAKRSMSVEGMLKSAEADVLMKQRELEKLKELRGRDHASQQEVDRIETELKVAEARTQSVREDLEIKQLESQRIESQLEQRIVRAPIDGIVTELARDPGEFVSPSDPTIARIVQLDQLLIVFSVPLMHRNEVSEKETVNLLIGTEKQKASGIVEFVAPTPDASNSSVRVKVRVANEDRQFQSGEPAELLLESLSEQQPKATQESTPVARREKG